ncbi:MAG: hypothetical protein R3F31_22520 [Verrucomicrobiales bacterium]
MSAPQLEKAYGTTLDSLGIRSEAAIPSARPIPLTAITPIAQSLSRNLLSWKNFHGGLRLANLSRNLSRNPSWWFWKRRKPTGDRTNRRGQGGRGNAGAGAHPESGSSRSDLVHWLQGYGRTGVSSA